LTVTGGTTITDVKNTWLSTGVHKSWE